MKEIETLKKWTNISGYTEHEHLLEIIQNKYERLLAFVIWVSNPDIPLSDLYARSDAGYYASLDSIKAREVLKELGEP